MQDIVTHKVLIRGIRPLIMHNGQLADPLNPWVKRKQAITKKKASEKNTEENQVELSRLEFIGGMYLGCADKKGNKVPVIPGDNLVRMMRDGAAVVRKGKDFEAAVDVVEEEVPVLYKGPTDPEEMFRLTTKGGDFVHRFRRSVRQGQVVVQRTRCRFPEWALEFTVEIQPDAGVESDDLRAALEVAGRRKGLGDWHPRYGRFVVEAFE